MTLKNRFELFRGITPAIAVFVCVCLALSAYVAPTYNLDPLPELQTPVLGLTDEEAGSVGEELEPLKEAVREPEKKGEKLEKIEEPDLYIDGTYYGAAFGYNDDVRVEVTVTDGKIASIKVVEHYDDQPYMKDAEKKVIPAIINKQTTNVDACSGATFSSNGIIEAVREALADAGTEANPENSGDNSTVPPEGDVPGDTEIPGETESPDEPPIPGEGDDTSDYVYKDGIYNNDDNMVLCENPRETSWAYYLSIQVTITDGKITAISESKKEGKNGEYDYQNNSYLTRAFEGIGKRKGMAAKIIENQGTAGVDTVTGATVTSDAIIQAVDIILSTVEKVPAAEDVPDQNVPEDLLKPEDSEDVDQDFVLKEEECLDPPEEEEPEV